MLKSGIQYALSAALLGMSALIPHAQSVDDLLEMSVEELADLKIFTASRSEKSIRDLPATVHIVTREEILKNNYATLVDVMKDLPGIKVSQPGTGTHGEKYLMRGMWGNNYVKLLINGIPVTPSGVDGFPIGEQLSMKNVERIEVVYGPAAALYGADALAGVINIRTFNPDRNVFHLDVSGGTSDDINTRYKSARFFMHQMHGDMKVSAHGGYSSRDDYNIPKAGSGAFAENDLFGNPVLFADMPSESRNFGMEMLYKDFRLSFANMYRADHSSLEQESKFYLFDNPDLKWGETIQNLSLQHRLDLGKFSFNSSASYLRYRLDTESAFGMIFYPGPLYKYSASDDLLFEETAVFNPNKTVEFVAGFSYLQSGAMPKSNDLIKPFDEEFYQPFSMKLPPQGEYQSELLGDFGWNPLVFFNLGGFLQASLTLNDLVLVAGVRFDDHSEYDSKINPRIAALYKIAENTSVRASFNEAFRAPPPYKVYNSIAVDNGDGSIYYIHLPNTGLEPEKLMTIEAGVKHLLLRNLSLEMVYYRNRITAMMTSLIVPIGPEYRYADRDSSTVDANSRGTESVLHSVDFIAEMQNIYAPVKLGGALYFSYSQGHETLPNGDEIDLFRNVPEFLFKLRLDASPVKNLFFGIDQIYISEWFARVYSRGDMDLPDRQSDGYYLMDVTASYTLPSKQGNTRIHLKLNNAFDAEFGGFKFVENPQYMRSYYCGIEYFF